MGHAGSSAPLLEGTVRVIATVQPDLQTIEGKILVPHHADLRLIDALSRVPKPASDQAAQRTWPAAPETGWVKLRAPRPDGYQPFRSIIPRRWGASGMAPKHGLFINGLWHPQPVLSDRIPVTRWEVEIRAPPGAIVVLNSAVGEGVVRWKGMADRLSLAVVPKGRARRLDVPGQHLILVDHGPHRRKRDARLSKVIPTPWPLEGGEPIVVVQAPMYRRLFRHGPGMIFLSHRATRLTGKLWRHHISAIRRGLLSAGTLSPDPWARELAAHHFADSLPPGPTASQTLNYLAWIPGIDALLYDGSLPFASELMGETWPSDPVRDDLLEMIEDVVPSQVASRKLTGLFGWEKVSILAKSIAKGQALDDAARSAKIPLDVLAQWRTPAPPQNLSLTRRPVPGGGRTITITRETGKDAPPEPIPFRVDGVDRTWLAGAGPGSEGVEIPVTPRRVVLDPGGDVLQTRRDDDGWPPRWTPTFFAGISELSLNQARPTASAFASLRRQYGTRWVYGMNLGTDPRNLLSGSLTVSRAFGPLKDRRSRSYRIWMSTGASILDPHFRPTKGGRSALDSWVGGSWDTRGGWPLPQRGHRIAAYAGAGWVPSSDQRWGAGYTYGSGLLPLTSWAVVAGRAGGGMAVGGVEHRQIPLGGTGGVQGLSHNAVLGQAALASSVELRTLPLRHASVPLPLAWGSHLQISGGLDAGVAWHRGNQIRSVGWAAGLAGVADLLGARPTLGGIWIARAIPAWTSGVEVDSWPQLYLRFRQPF